MEAAMEAAREAAREAAESSRAARRSNPNVMVFLSIFLLMLGFFILLNALSSVEQLRVEMAVGSVAATFSSGRETPSELIAAGTRSGVFTQGATFREALEGMFEPSIPLETAALTRPGSVLEARVPARYLYRWSRAELHSRTAPMLETMADNLTRDEPDRRFEVELLLGAGPALARGRAPERAFLLERPAAFANALRARGVPGTSIRIALGEAPIGEARLTFFDRATDEAAVTFEALAR